MFKSHIYGLCDFDSVCCFFLLFISLSDCYCFSLWNFIYVCLLTFSNEWNLLEFCFFFFSIYVQHLYLLHIAIIYSIQFTTHTNIVNMLMFSVYTDAGMRYLFYILLCCFWLFDTSQCDLEIIFVIYILIPSFSFIISYNKVL